MMQATSNIKRDDGYALLELLVSVAIIALLSIPIAGSISLGLDTWTKSHETAQTQERILLTRSRISDWLNGTYPLDNRRTANHYIYPLTGTSETIEFTTALHPDPMADSLYRLRLRVQETVLQVGVAPDFDYLAGGDVWEWADLLGGVTSMTIEYMEGRDASSQIIWASNWGGTVETVNTPLAVKLVMNFEDADIIWHDLIIPLTLDEHAFCRFLPNERQCLSGAVVG